MSHFRSFLHWFRFSSEPAEGSGEINSPAPPVSFHGIRDVLLPPSDVAIEPGVVYRVLRNGNPKWALFRCPCDCGVVVTLSLQRAHRPHWFLREGKDTCPTLRPSIWRDVGCLSHFWLDDGRVYWCSNTGTSPWRITDTSEKSNDRTG